MTETLSVIDVDLARAKRDADALYERLRLMGLHRLAGQPATLEDLREAGEILDALRRNLYGGALPSPLENL